MGERGSTRYAWDCGAERAATLLHYVLPNVWSNAAPLRAPAPVIRLRRSQIWWPRGSASSVRERTRALRGLCVGLCLCAHGLCVGLVRACAAPGAAATSAASASLDAASCRELLHPNVVFAAAAWLFASRCRYSSGRGATITMVYPRHTVCSRECVCLWTECATVAGVCCAYVQV